MTNSNHDERASDQSSPRGGYGPALGRVASLARCLDTSRPRSRGAQRRAHHEHWTASHLGTPRFTTDHGGAGTRNDISPNPTFSPGRLHGTTGSENCANPCVECEPDVATFTNARRARYVLAAINNARALESVAPMVLRQLGESQRSRTITVSRISSEWRGATALPGLNSALDREPRRRRCTR